MATLSIIPVSQISPDSNVVMSEIFITAPRERIFEALTDAKQAAQWWGQNDRYHFSEFNLDARVGGKWSSSGSSLNMGAFKIEGEILELDPPRRLAYTWLSSWMPRNTKVLWELEGKDGGTLVKLTHSGFAGDAEQANNHSTGWNSVLGWLQAYAEKGETIASRK
jgi:uncharacterized protein YndB with AHSA1/START domain